MLGILLPHLGYFAVLLLEDLVEVVVLDEPHQSFRRDIPAPRDLDLADRPFASTVAAQDGVSQEQTGALAAELAVAGVGLDHPVDEPDEVLGPDVLLGDRDEVELVGQEAADQPDMDAVEGGGGELGVVGEKVVEPAYGAGDLRQTGSWVVEHCREEAGLVFHDPVLGQRNDGVGAEVASRELERLTGEQD